MKVLVTGGAGYIGSHTVKALRDAGHQPIIVDNLSSQLSKPPQDLPLQVVDITNFDALQKACQNFNFDAVIHFAAKIEVAESMSQPINYYDNNVLGLLNITRLMQEKNCKKIIFSSTAAVYGIPENIPVSEEAPLKPINVYGRSKLMCEQILQDCTQAYGWSATALRYFNASGASTDGTLGQHRKKYSHAIPLMIFALLKDTPFNIFGTHYNTKDGTAVRDYIHVQDLADAHIRALENLSPSNFNTFNVGTGLGFTVRELINTLENIADKKMNVVEQESRIGDPPILIAQNQKITSALGWSPRYSDLHTILSTAYFWHKKLASQEGA